MDKLQNIVTIILTTKVGFIQFIVLLDNNGKRIYAKYFSREGTYLSETSNQKLFEKKIGTTAVNLNVNKNYESNYSFLLKIKSDDVFNLDEFTIISKIGKEVAIFIGGSQNDNEIVRINNNILRSYQI